MTVSIPNDAYFGPTSFFVATGIAIVAISIVAFIWWWKWDDRRIERSSQASPFPYGDPGENIIIDGHDAKEMDT